jgi:hypothetical protein
MLGIGRSQPANQDVGGAKSREVRVIRRSPELERLKYTVNRTIC